jgi:hypothetical protein
MEQPKMLFVLSGFNQEMGFRVFSFDGVAADRSRVPYTVKIDLALAQRYGIRLQELPLLCRGLLDRCHEEDAQQSFTYAEEDMCRYATAVSVREEAAKNRKPPRRPVTSQAGAGWRNPAGLSARPEVKQP